jgi:hypothetical protein
MVVERGNGGGEMKGYIKPKHIELGTCFICGEPRERYCHLPCALSFDSEKQRLIDEAKINDLKQLLEEKNANIQKR